MTSGMRTAEEWMKEEILLKDKQGSDLKLVEILRVVQLDAFKAGAEWAANTCKKRDAHGGVSDEDVLSNYGPVATFLIRKILYAAEQLKELPK